MKKIIVCICLLISTFLTVFTVAYAQSENDITGIWYNPSNEKEEQNKRYFFKTDGSFVYGSNYSTKEEGDLLYSEGTWKLENNMLILTINGNIMKDAQGKINYQYPMKKEVLQYSFTFTQEKNNKNEKVVDTIMINGLKYQKPTNKYIYYELLNDYTKITYVGVWHADLCFTDTDVYSYKTFFRKRYLFKQDGTFAYGTNTKSRDDSGNVLYLDGNWAIEKNMLTLKVNGKVIEKDGKNEYMKLEVPQTFIYNIANPEDTASTADYSPVTHINGLQYWKFSDEEDTYKMFEDYNEFAPVSNPLNFCGNWNKTEISIAQPASLIITDQKDGKFKFKFEATQSNSIYRLEGEATIYKDNTARFYYTQSNKNSYILFVKDTNKISIVLSNYPIDDKWADSSILKGDYIQGAAQYVDYDSEAIKNEKIEESIKKVMGKQAFEQMMTVMNDAPNQNRLTYTGILEEKNIKVELLINKDHIYCLAYNLEYPHWVLYTDDKTYKSSVPKFFQFYDGGAIQYVYKES